MEWMFLWLALGFASQIWLCFRVSRSSVPLAIATFFIGFPAAVYTLFKHRGDKDTSVTVPFLANLVFSVLFVVSAWSVIVGLIDAEEMPAASIAAAPMAERAAAPVAPAAAASSPVMAVAASAPAPAASAAAPDAIDKFSDALRSSGVNNTVTRLSSTTTWPAGVVDGALITAAPAAPVPASAPGFGEMSATLLLCNSASDCRDLARAFMEQGGTEKRRV
ncbi:MAG TPA: hypothetical protein VJ598_05490, partial [Albitalea sp.]|nr:hypothetical protein [Albitalea sp.]